MPLLSASLLGLLSLCSAHAIHHHHHHQHHQQHEVRGLVNADGGLDVLNDTRSVPEIAKRASDPADFSWIKRWAAVGDSFTAGIGSGTPLGSALSNKADWDCSRYDRSYAQVLNRAFGPSVDNFQFVACSGDRTEDIYTQVQNMQGNLDLVILTAGGNDLCLVREHPSPSPAV